MPCQKMIILELMDHDLENNRFYSREDYTTVK